MPTDPAAVRHRLSERLAPLERPLRVFAPGASLAWRDLVVAATGRPLGPEAFLAGLGE